MADVIKYRFRLRRRTAASWMAINEVLLGSEIGHESDTDKIKIGDGTTAWNDLPYFAAGSASSGVNRQTGTSYTLTLIDDGYTVLCSNAAAIVVTIPTNSAVPFLIGAKIAYTQGDAGAVTVVGATGVSVRAPNGATTHSPFDGGVMEKIGPDEWQLWNGPSLAAVATTGSYNDLLDKPGTTSGAAPNEQTATSYTLALTDFPSGVRASNSSAVALTIPANSTTPLPLYVPIPVFQGSTGAVTITGASAVTIEKPNGDTTTAQGDFRVVYQRATDKWVIA